MTLDFVSYMVGAVVCGLAALVAAWRQREQHRRNLETHVGPELARKLLACMETPTTRSQAERDKILSASEAAIQKFNPNDTPAPHRKYRPSLH